jgi:hypothetical protein
MLQHLEHGQYRVRESQAISSTTLVEKGNPAEVSAFSIAISILFKYALSIRWK